MKKTSKSNSAENNCWDKRKYSFVFVQTEGESMQSAHTSGDYHSQGHGVVKAVNELIGGVPSIEKKGKFDQTHIWFGIIAEPRYEYKLTEISDLMNAGQLAEALEKAKAAYAEFENAKILNFISAIESKIIR